MPKDYYIGPDTLKSEISLRSLDAKIDLYQRRLEGWYINVAKALRNNRSMPEGGPGADPVSLMIAMSLFEPLGVLLQGKKAPLKDNGEPQSKDNFEYGFLDFLSRKHSNWPEERRKDIAAIVYKQVRCGLFHLNTAKKKVWYNRGPDDEHPTPSIKPTYRNTKLAKLTFNVPAFILEVDDYFKQYVAEVLNHASERRKRFAEGWKIIRDSLE